MLTKSWNPYPATPPPHPLKALEAADRIPFCPPHITESGHYATTASPTPRQIYFLSSLPAKPSQLSALRRRSDSILPLSNDFPANGAQFSPCNCDS